MRNPFRRDPADTRAAAVRRTFMTAARREHPLWWNPTCNPDGPDGIWDRRLADWTATLAWKAPDADPLEVMGHVLDRWPGRVLGYNANYGTGRARDMGILDKVYRPARGDGPPVDDEARVRRELLDIGGRGALAAYDQATRGLR